MRILLFLFIATSIFAQYHVSYHASTIPESPASFAIGGASSASQHVDAMNILTNPALVGFYASKVNMAYGFNPGNENWYKDLGIELQTNSMFTGYKFKNLYKNLSLSLGAGYSFKDYNFTYYPYRETSESILLGLSAEYYVSLSFGVNIKRLKEDQSLATTMNVDKIGSNDNVIDWGLHLLVPVKDLVCGKDRSYQVGDFSLKPNFDFSFGYSKRNISNMKEYNSYSVFYFPDATTTMGYEVDLGFTAMYKELSIKVLNIAFAADAVDNMTYDIYGVRYNGLTKYHENYPLPNTALKLFDNVFGMESSNRITIRKGWKFSLLETFSYGLGNFVGGSYYDSETSGYSLSTSGLLKFINYKFNNNKYVGYVLNGLQIDYNYAEVFKGQEYEVEMDSYNISIKLPF